MNAKGTLDDVRDQVQTALANGEAHKEFAVGDIQRLIAELDVARQEVAKAAHVRAERDQLRLELEQKCQAYDHLVEQHMPRTGDGCDAGWSRVVEANELQAQVDRLTAENQELRAGAAMASQDVMPKEAK